jgi:thiol-disulfide isomerase/thioredoxin
MPRKRLDWIILTVVVAVVGSIWIGMTAVKASALNTAGKPARAELGYIAPDFTLTSPAGDEVVLSKLKGKPIVLNFWATWCPPCRAETPALVAAHKQWGDEITIVGVDVLESPQLVTPFMSEYGIKYPIALDSAGEVAAAYRVISYPTTYFIDSSGTIVQIANGPVNEAFLQTQLANMVGR